LDLTIRAGDIAGILGQNGAGKTTMFQMMTGNLKADQGEITIQSQRMLPDRSEVKKTVGYLPQGLELPKWVTGNELLSYAIRLYELQQPDQQRQDALSYWDCLDFAHKPLAACSHGMQKRIGLALATVHQPQFLILDEPFSGLDLYHIRALQDLIKRRQSEGKATILCTHIAPYAAQLCNRIVLVDEGQLFTLEDWHNAELMERIRLIEEFFFDDNKRTHS
jgi:ABC-type multidrug transport system ATPase subunit